MSVDRATMDAHVILRMTLANYGLDSQRLADWALESLITGASLEQILLELEQQPEYKAAFPEIEARRRRGAELGIQLEPINPAMVLEYRTKARALMRSYGVPATMFDTNEDFATFIIGDKSLDELGEELKLASQRVYTAHPDVRAAFTDLFGPQGDEALFLWFVDGQRSTPVLENMVQQAEATGAARRMGFGITEAEARRIEAANLTYEQALEGFAAIDATRGLYDETLYEEGRDFTVGGEGIEAAFNLEGGAREAVEQRAGARKASTGGTSRAATEERGVVGLGEAGRR